MDDITRYSVFWNAIRSIDAFDASFPDNQWLEGLEGGGSLVHGPEKSSCFLSHLSSWFMNPFILHPLEDARTSKYVR